MSLREIAAGLVKPGRRRDQRAPDAETELEVSYARAGIDRASPSLQGRSGGRFRRPRPIGKLASAVATSIDVQEEVTLISAGSMGSGCREFT